MNRDDSCGIAGFLGLATIVGAYFFGKSSGEQKAYKICADQQRDKEIEDLKRQIAYMRQEKL